MSGGEAASRSVRPGHRLCHKASCPKLIFPLTGKELFFWNSSTFSIHPASKSSSDRLCTVSSQYFWTSSNSNL